MRSRPSVIIPACPWPLPWRSCSSADWKRSSSRDERPHKQKRRPLGPPFLYSLCSRLAFGELEAAARLRPAILLALDRARVAGEEAARLQRGAQRRLVIDQGAGNAVTHGAGLAGKATAID